MQGGVNNGSCSFRDCPIIAEFTETNIPLAIQVFRFRFQLRELSQARSEEKLLPRPNTERLAVSLPFEPMTISLNDQSSISMPR